MTSCDNSTGDQKNSWIKDTFLIIIARDLTFVTMINWSKLYKIYLLCTPHKRNWRLIHDKFRGRFIFPCPVYIAGWKTVLASVEFICSLWQAGDTGEIARNATGTQELFEPRALAWVWLTEQLTTNFAVFVVKFAWTAQIAQNTRKAVKLSDRFWFTLAVFSVENV